MRLLPVFAALALAQPLSAQTGADPSLSPASTADSASDGPYACLFETMTTADRERASAAASFRMTDVPVDGEQMGGSQLDAILAGIPRCADLGQWTAAQRELASTYAMSQLAREHMRRRYAAQRVDLSFLDDLAGDFSVSTENPARFEAAAARLRAQGVTGQRPDSAEDIVHIYLTLARGAEELKAEFADVPPREGSPR